MIIYVYNKYQNYTMENKRNFNILPVCFDQSGPSSGKTYKMQSINFVSFTLETIQLLDDLSQRIIVLQYISKTMFKFRVLAVANLGNF